MTHHETTPTHGGLTTAKIVLPGVIILLAGIAIGAAAMYLAMSDRNDTQRHEPERFTRHVLGRLSHELKLTEQQRQQLEPILRQHHRTMRQIRDEARPRIVAELEQLNTAILEVLDERQAQLWQDRLDRIEEQFPTFRRRGPGPRTPSENGRRRDGTGPHHRLDPPPSPQDAAEPEPVD